MSDRTPTILTDEQCWERLNSHEFGRLAYHLTDEVHLVPVNYAADGGRLLIRTAEGSKLLGVVMNSDVAFEIDEVDDDAEIAWSVVARGRAEILDGDAARAADALPLLPWVPEPKFIIVAITPSEVSGREFPLARSGRRLRPDQA